MTAPASNPRATFAVAGARLAAGFITLAGPALVLTAHSDRGPWANETLESTVFSLMSGLPLAFVFGSTLALGIAAPATSILRLLQLSSGTVTVLIISGAAAFPVMYGLGESRTCFGVSFALLLTVVTIPAAAIQVWSQPVPDHRAWQFSSLILGAGGAVIIAAASSSSGFCAGPPTIPSKVWESWPAILALFPTAALVMKAARPVHPLRAALLLLLATLPFYTAKAVFDSRQRDGLQVVVWPARVVAEFISWSERSAVIKDVTSLRLGRPIRIGEHWYQFNRVGLWNPFVGMKRWPNRVVGAQIDIPVEDIELPEARIGNSRWIQLNIDSGPNALRNAAAHNELYITAADEDLSIKIISPRDRELDRNAVREKLRRFIQSARTTAPEELRSGKNE